MHAGDTGAKVRPAIIASVVVKHFRGANFKNYDNGHNQFSYRLRRMGYNIVGEKLDGENYKTYWMPGTAK
jgi:hypothetical protein